MTCNSDVGNQDLCVTSTFRKYMNRRVHESQDRHTVRGAGEGSDSEIWNNTKACICRLV
jgi:hypothetical protein